MAVGRDDIGEDGTGNGDQAGVAEEDVRNEGQVVPVDVVGTADIADADCVHVEARTGAGRNGPNRGDCHGCTPCRRASFGLGLAANDEDCPNRTEAEEGSLTGHGLRIGPEIDFVDAMNWNSVGPKNIDS